MEESSSLSTPNTIMGLGQEEVDQEEKGMERINLPLELIQEVKEDFSGECLDDSLFGPCPPRELSRKWMEEKWIPLVIMVEDVQVLPNGFYIF